MIGLVLPSGPSNLREARAPAVPRSTAVAAAAPTAGFCVCKGKPCRPMIVRLFRAYSYADDGRCLRPPLRPGGTARCPAQPETAAGQGGVRQYQLAAVHGARPLVRGSCVDPERATAQARGYARHRPHLLLEPAGRQSGHSVIRQTRRLAEVVAERAPPVHVGVNDSFSKHCGNDESIRESMALDIPAVSVPWGD